MIVCSLFVMALWYACSSQASVKMVLLERKKNKMLGHWERYGRGKAGSEWGVLGGSVVLLIEVGIT